MVDLEETPPPRRQLRNLEQRGPPPEYRAESLADGAQGQGGAAEGGEIGVKHSQLSAFQLPLARTRSKVDESQLVMPFTSEKELRNEQNNYITNAPMRVFPGEQNTPVYMYRSWTFAEVKALAKEMPSTRQNPARFWEERKMIVECHRPTITDLDILLKVAIHAELLQTVTATAG